MLVDDGVLSRTTGAGRRRRPLGPSRSRRRSTRCSTARLDRLEPRGARGRRASSRRRPGRSGGARRRALAAASEADADRRTCSRSSRKELIAPDRRRSRQEDAFRFTHILMRDAAYHGDPEDGPGRLHEQLADWIEAPRARSAGDYEEFVGYHLEQAHRALHELGPPTERTRDARGRAARPLARPASARSPAATCRPPSTSSARAAALLPSTIPRRLELLPELAFALIETGDFDGSRRRRARWTRRPRRPATRAAGARDRRRRSGSGSSRTRRAGPTRPSATRPRAIRSFERARGRARAGAEPGRCSASCAPMYARFGPAEEAWSQAAGMPAGRAAARGAGEPVLGAAHARVRADPGRGGHPPLPRGLRAGRGRPEGHVQRAVLPGRLRGVPRALRRGARAARPARALLEEVALPVWAAGPLAQEAGWIELLAGDPAAAERELRRGLRLARRDRRGRRGSRPTPASSRRRSTPRASYDEARRSPGSARSWPAPRTSTRTSSGAACGRRSSPAEARSPRRSARRRERRG